MSQRRGFCIYCRGPGLSKEHIWPKWLRDYIDMDDLNYPLQRAIEYPTHITDSIKVISGHPFSRRVRMVCSNCNNGWMSQIQEDVKPVIVDLFQGKRFEIFRRPRRLISSWAAMSTIAADATSERFAVVSEEERKEFFRNRLPPEHWRIWIGLCSDNIKAPNYRHYSSELLSNKDRHRSGSISEAATIQATTYRIRRLAVHVMTSSNEAGREVIRKWKWRRFRPYLTRIWPVTHATVTWPPSHELTEADVETVAARLYDKMAEMRSRAVAPP
jgi:hypothetical protein